MKGVEKPRTSVITVRQALGSARITDWEAICGDCGRCDVKPYRSKTAAVKAGTKHDKEAHGGNAVLRIAN